MDFKPINQNLLSMTTKNWNNESKN